MYTHCSSHTNREVKPACPTCDRIAVENDLVTRVVDALLDAGYRLTIPEDVGARTAYRPETPTTDRAVILRELMETDEEHLACLAPGATEAGFVYFVYGNGCDVIADYSLTLESVLAEVNAYAEAIAP